MHGKLRFVVFSVLIVAVWLGCSSDDSSVTPVETPYPIEGDEYARLYEWAIGPIPGITTAWHPTPAEISVPVGTTLKLKCGGSAPDDVHWTNAVEVRHGDFGSFAEVRLTTAGRLVISADVVGNDDGTGKDKGGDRPNFASHTCVVNVVDASPKVIGVQELRASVNPLLLSESSTNYETMRAFFDGPAGPLRRVDADTYRTSVSRGITFEGMLIDPRFASLIETRITGERPQLMASFSRKFDRPGRYTVSVGPPETAKNLVIQTFAVTITSHTDEVDMIPDGEPVTFEARTDPSGYENEITWIASTQYGSVTPVVGRGPSFTVTFSNTSPPDQVQWLGVRADNAVIDQDLTLAGLLDDFKGTDPEKADAAYMGLRFRGKAAIAALLGCQSEVQSYAGEGFYDSRSSIARLDPASVGLMALYVIEAIYYDSYTPYHAPILHSQSGPDPTLSQAYSHYQSWWSSVGGYPLEQIRHLPPPLASTPLFWAGDVMLSVQQAAPGTGTKDNTVPETPYKKTPGGAAIWERSLDGPDAGTGDDPYNCVFTPANAGGPAPYNCLAWAINCYTDRWVQPADVAGEHWQDILTGHDYNTTPVACAGQCPAGKGPKVKMIWHYPAGGAKNDGNWVHAMKQEADGDWTSKNGSGFRYKDITDCTAFLDRYYPKGTNTREVQCFCKN